MFLHPPRFFLLSLALALAGGCAVEGAPADDDDATPSGPTPAFSARCDDAPGDNAGCMTLDDGRYDLPFGIGVVGSGTEDGRIRVAFGQDQGLAPPSLIVEYDRYAQTGVYDCTEDGVVVVILDPAGVSYSALADLAFLGTTCSLELTATGSTAGATLEGSLQAQVWETSAGPLHAASGRFNATLLED